MNDTNIRYEIRYQQPGMYTEDGRPGTERFGYRDATYLMEGVGSDGEAMRRAEDFCREPVKVNGELHTRRNAVLVKVTEEVLPVTLVAPETTETVGA